MHEDKDGAVPLPLARLRGAETPADVDRELAAALQRLGDGSDTEVARDALAALAATTKELLLTRERLAASLKARESLLASVSHDLRNPLNTFAMSVGLLRDDFESRDVDPARGVALLQRMERASERMQRLIEDLLEASRIQGGKVELVRRRESAAELLRVALSEAAPLAAERRVSLASEPLDDAAYVTADRAKALEILRKVLCYALRTCSDEGTVRASLQRQGVAVAFSIVSIIPGHRPAPVRVDEGRGGIALLIARGLVDAHGGTFRVDTDEATTFTFTLPV